MSASPQNSRSRERLIRRLQILSPTHTRTGLPMHQQARITLHQQRATTANPDIPAGIPFLMVRPDENL